MQPKNERTAIAANIIDAVELEKHRADLIVYMLTHKLVTDRPNEKLGYSELYYGDTPLHQYSTQALENIISACLTSK